VEAKWAKTGASTVYIGMGWGTEGDVEGLDIDLSLVPLNKGKKYIKDKVIYFNNKQPHSLSCSGGNYGYAMQAFADDRSGDAPGDDELVKINLDCLSKQFQDIETVVVMASIYRPQKLTWNMLDSVYMRLISGGHEEQRGQSFLVRDADSLRSFVRLSGDSQKANSHMEFNSLAVGMLFKEANGEWAFAGLMEGMKGSTALHAQKPLEKFMKTLNYPIRDDWDSDIDDESDMAKTEPCVSQDTSPSIDNMPTKDDIPNIG
jgi:stress response protein SCP2